MESVVLKMGLIISIKMINIGILFLFVCFIKILRNGFLPCILWSSSKQLLYNRASLFSYNYMSRKEKWFCLFEFKVHTLNLKVGGMLLMQVGKL